MRIVMDGEGDVRRTPIGDLTIRDSQFLTYPNGKFFIRYLYDDLIEKLAEDTHRNLQNDYDNIIVVAGPEGSGKSNLAWQICRAIDPEFDVSKQYVYDMDSFKEELAKGGERKPTWWMDEGSNLANNREWQSQDNRDIVSLLEMMRSRGWTMVICIPREERLDKYIRENRIRYMLHCSPMKFSHHGFKERGYFELKKRNNRDGFDLVGYGEYSQIPADEKKRYEEIKWQSQQKKIKQIIDGDEKKPSNGSKYKKMYEEERRSRREIMLRMHESGTDTQHLMDLFGIDSKQTFYNQINKAKRENNEY